MVKAERFILVSDLGILVKMNRDQSRGVYVLSLPGKEPVSGATVDILGLNGVPVMSRSTDATGQVAFPSLEELTREKKPVAVVVRHGGDLAFVPFERSDRQVNLSRFPVGGVAFASSADLDGFLFSERGIFRPGDEIRAGLVVKRGTGGAIWQVSRCCWSCADSRGRVVREQQVRLPGSGLVEFKARTQYVSPTGPYRLTAYLYKDDKRSDVLARTSMRVEEFEPDQMKVETWLTRTRTAGWVHPNALTAGARVTSLFGLPAAGRRVDATLTLSPARLSFPGFRRVPVF